MESQTWNMEPIDLESAEASRIRQVFEARDQGRQPSDLKRRAGGRLAAERFERMRRLVGTFLADMAQPGVLDVGCGGGGDLRRWQLAGWPPEKLAGVDLVPDRVSQARALGPGMDIRNSGGSELPFRDRQFDVATAATVFSSILDPSVRRHLFAEMERVVRPNGLIIVYDFVIRNPRNVSVEPIRLSTLMSIAGRRPDHSERLSPLIFAVVAGAAVHPALERVAMRLAPRTHRLSVWRVR
jgi:ubiquinone/menaquinone biosynthesis C-methylase UbiE